MISHECQDRNKLDLWFSSFVAIDMFKHLTHLTDSCTSWFSSFRVPNILYEHNVFQFGAFEWLVSKAGGYGSLSSMFILLAFPCLCIGH